MRNAVVPTGNVNDTTPKSPAVSDSPILGHTIEYPSAITDLSIYQRKAIELDCCLSSASACSFSEGNRLIAKARNYLFKEDEHLMVHTNWLSLIHI